jgi:hypothetical protein
MDSGTGRNIGSHWQVAWHGDNPSPRRRRTTLVRLALDIGLAGLALGVERVEGQVEIVLGRFARVDGAALRFIRDLPRLYPPPPL